MTVETMRPLLYDQRTARKVTEVLHQTALTLWFLLLFCSSLAAQVSPLDLLIVNGIVFDGKSMRARRVDVGVRGDRIVYVGNIKRMQARRVIDARGLIVAPGFIDPHTHTLEDLSDPNRKSNVNYLMQGVTTVITGNDGGGPIEIERTLRRWEEGGIGTNAALLVGHGTVRRQVMGMSDSAPTEDQLARMKELIGRAMDEGAFGMSTGLYYAPGSYARTEEVIELAKVVAAKGGIYDTHMRDEDSYSIGLLGSIRETLRIGREASIPVHISHIKALGREVWGQSGAVIKLIHRARVEGIEVTADQYPYTASGTSLIAALVPRWAEAGGRDQLLARLADEPTRVRLLAEMERNLQRRGGPASLLITSSRDPSLRGKTLAIIAAERHAKPVEAALEIIRELGDVGVASFNMNERDIENFMKQSWVVTGSDGSTGHPRKYGTFPRKLREYVFRRRVISLPFAIRVSSALTAEIFRLPQRGRIAPGYFADLIVFDPQKVADRATYEQPELLAVGMRYVIVNGQLAVEDGRYTGALAGRALRR